MILTISGSSRPDSSNVALLKALAAKFPDKELKYYNGIHNLPIFNPSRGGGDQVLKWKNAVNRCRGIIISTPEYIHNLPAVVKNALEWLTESGELQGMPILPIVYTPHPPRGEKTLHSLLWTLTALDAQVLPSLQLYRTEVKIIDGKLECPEDIAEMISLGINQF